MRNTFPLKSKPGLLCSSQHKTKWPQQTFSAICSVKMWFYFIFFPLRIRLVKLFIFYNQRNSRVFVLPRNETFLVWNHRLNFACWRLCEKQRPPSGMLRRKASCAAAGICQLPVIRAFVDLPLLRERSGGQSEWGLTFQNAVAAHKYINSQIFPQLAPEPHIPDLRSHVLIWGRGQSSDLHGSCSSAAFSDLNYSCCRDWSEATSVNRK